MMKGIRERLPHEGQNKLLNSIWKQRCLGAAAFLPFWQAAPRIKAMDCPPRLAFTVKCLISLGQFKAKCLLSH